MNIGPAWDTYAFLINAEYFAGQSFGSVDFIRPVLLSFLTSLFFRLGYVSEMTIFAIDGAFFVFGVIGLYLFLKLRFNNIQSFLGALLFISFPVVLLWAGAGYTDVASTSLSIWALYLTVLAVKRNPKFFYLSFPLAMLAFLTRFPAAIIIFPMFLYILMNKENTKNLKDISRGILISLLILIPVLIFFYNTLGNPFLPFLGTYSSTAGSGANSAFAYNPNPFYYLTNSIYSFINMDFLNSSLLGLVIAFIIVMIMALYFVVMGINTYIHVILRQHKIKNWKNPSKLGKNELIKILTFLIILLTFILTINRVQYILSAMIFVILCYYSFKLLKTDKLKGLDIDFLVLSWVMSYLIFNSTFSIKVCRYFIPMAPAVAYFVMLGLTEFSVKIKWKIKNISLTSILNILLIFIVLLSTTAYLYHLANDPLSSGSNFVIKNEKFQIMSESYSGELYFETYSTQNEIKTVKDWFECYDPNYKNKIIYSDYFWPHLSWYLKNDVKHTSNNDTTDKYLNNELKMANADYYISITHKVNLKDYVEVKEFKTRFGTINIYKRLN